MDKNNNFIIACCNLAFELIEKDEKLLTKREEQFLNAFDKFSDEVLEQNAKLGSEEFRKKYEIRRSEDAN